ncbi:hypothetical protein [Brucella pituitosa]|uniref:Uncharacterized protein n=2 Tax=Brucella TaxID=234 RepID=A0A643ET34_9HYPH|nr:hypothetical protein [Brucella pituitosa]KAB0565039.1 hypothetical protein F7Q93_23750 [Brucella pituitosa]
MKSWSERLVAGLKNWRSRNNDTGADATSGVQSPADTSPEPSDDGSKAKLSIRVTVEDFEGTGVDAIPQIEPPTPLEASPVLANEVQPPEALSSQPEPTHEAANEPSTSSSVSKPTQNLSRGRSSKSKDGLMAGNDLTVSDGEGDSANEAAENKSVISKRKLQFDHELQKVTINTTPAKELEEADGNASIGAEPVNPSEALVSFEEANALHEPSSGAEPPRIEQATDKDATIPGASMSPQMRSRDRKPKATDELVTDEMLAELEAENARLKRLLREKLSAIKDNSEN